MSLRTPIHLELAGSAMRAIRKLAVAVLKKYISLQMHMHLELAGNVLMAIKRKAIDVQNLPGQMENIGTRKLSQGKVGFLSLVKY